MKIALEEVEERELITGFRGRMVHSERTTLAWWKIDAGASLPEHSHPHEQVVNLLEGEFELDLDGETLRLAPGDAVVIAPDRPHAGRALTDCRILDVFAPVREDYR